MRPRARSLLPALCLWTALHAPLACRSSPEDSNVTQPASPAGSAEVAPAATPVAARALGELARAVDYTMSVDAVRDCHVPERAAPRRGYVRVGLDVTIEGISEREVPANPFYASLRDASGEVYVGALTGCDPPLPTVRLRHGKKARGHLNFDVLKSAVAFELRYAPPVIGQGTEEVRFTLRR